MSSRLTHIASQPNLGQRSLVSAVACDICGITDYSIKRSCRYSVLLRPPPRLTRKAAMRLIVAAAASFLLALLLLLQICMRNTQRTALQTEPAAWSLIPTCNTGLGPL